jgi:hypothetical protein
VNHAIRNIPLRASIVQMHSSYVEACVSFLATQFMHHLLQIAVLAYNDWQSIIQPHVYAMKYDSATH